MGNTRWDDHAEDERDNGRQSGDRTYRGRIQPNDPAFGGDHTDGLTIRAEIAKVLAVELFADVLHSDNHSAHELWQAALRCVAGADTLIMALNEIPFGKYFKYKRDLDKKMDEFKQRPSESCPDFDNTSSNEENHHPKEHGPIQPQAPIAAERIVKTPPQEPPTSPVTISRSYRRRT